MKKLEIIKTIKSCADCNYCLKGDSSYYCLHPDTKEIQCFYDISVIHKDCLLPDITEKE